MPTLFDPQTIPVVVGFLIALKLAMSIGAAVFAFRIARMSVTPSGIWYVYMAAFIGMIIRAVERFFYLDVYTETASKYGITPVFSDLVLAAAIYLLFFIATAKVFYDLKSKFKGLV